MEETSKHSEFIPPRTQPKGNKIFESRAINILGPSTAKTVPGIIFEGLNKPKRPLSVYNIFYREERKLILEGKGYVIKDDVIGGQEFSINHHGQGVKKKRGRPRGKNYKKKTPHRMIGFEELTKCISKRWKLKKKEYNRLYNSIVEEKRHRYKEEMIAYKKKTKHILENAKTSDTNLNSKEKRYEPFICQNEEEGKFVCSNEMLHDGLPEIEPINIFDEYGVSNECNMLVFEKNTKELQNYQHHDECFPLIASKTVSRDEYQMFENNDSSCLDYEQSQKIESNSNTQPTTSINYEHYPIYDHHYNNRGPYRMEGNPKHNYDISQHQANYHNLHPGYNFNSYHERPNDLSRDMVDCIVTNTINGDSNGCNSHEQINPNQVPHLNQHSADASWHYQRHQFYDSNSVHSDSSTLPSNQSYHSQTNYYLR